MKHCTIRIVGQIEQIAAGPIGLERFWVAVRQGGRGRRVVRKRAVVHIFRTLRRRCARLRRGGSALRRIGQDSGLGRRFRRPLDARNWIRRRGWFDGSLRLLHRRSGCNIDQRRCLGAWLGTDPLCLPVLLFGLVVCSLHVGARITIVGATNIGDAGQGQQVFFMSRSIQLFVELRHMHRDVFCDGLVCYRWLRWK